MSENRNLLFCFVLIAFVVLLLGVNSHWQLSRISKDTNDLYRHPFAVSNAAQRINFHLVSMHRHMKDVVLAKSDSELLQAIDAVAAHEQHVLHQFAIIFERFLGDHDTINKSYEAFIHWKHIRLEVIQLMREKQYQRAIIITKAKGASHVANLNRLVADLVEFSFNKAATFHSQAHATKNNAIIINLILSALLLSLVILCAVHMVKKINKGQKKRKYKAHLIDQHIMLATMSANLTIDNVSSALCRFLGARKQDIVGKSNFFFDNSDDCEQLIEEILSSIETGKEWQGEIRHFDHQGNISWANSKILPQYDEHYNVIGYSNILVSITSKKLSGVDKLTSMLNRRRYDETIQHEMRIAKRNEHHFTLVILDIDYFKKFNDHYGHPQGDLALQQVSEKIISFIHRPNDYAFRIGGEEFAIIFSCLDVDKTKQFLDQIRLGIESLKIEHAASDISQYVTASFGACVVDANDNLDEEQLYIEADKALYLAKEQRNTVVVTKHSNATSR